MIKAQAYGHGAVWAARTLVGERGLYGFGVATFDEAIELRKALGAKIPRFQVLVFSGAAPWNDEKARLCARWGITPVISTDEDWAHFMSRRHFKRMPYELKFNTGMNRLGLSMEMLPRVAHALRKEGSRARPKGILSHLAQGEDPGAPLSKLQLERFVEIRSKLGSLAPDADYHLANSGALWNFSHWRLKDLTQAVRIGISLYGVPPWPGAPARGIAPVMTYYGTIAQRRRLLPGDAIGYDASFRVAKGARPVEVAIVSAGYADGTHRILSNQSRAWVVNQGRGSHGRVLGKISMDLSAVECPKSAKIGDRVEFLGPHNDIWELSNLAGTVPYELLTSVSSRVQRNYVT